MSDLIRREDAIKALGECPLNWTDTAEEIQAVEDWECHKAAIEAVPSATDEEFEWCHDCKEYDQENYCCHRWTKVIRNTVAELTADRPKGEWIYCEDYVGHDGYKCSECGFFVPWCYDVYADSNFIRHYHTCPHCDSRMKGADDE